MAWGRTSNRSKRYLLLLLIGALGAAVYGVVGASRPVTCGDERAIGTPSCDLAFDLAGRTPRVMHPSDQKIVPVAITNTGTRAWNADRIGVSYHWLWLIPRELPRRSRWSLPYHEGIRTKLGGDVQPGTQVEVDGRLLAPEWPGLYWLQWDMVEEGATWFAQVSPRQPRQLVIVLPTLRDLVALLPLLVALAAVGALIRTRASPRRSPFVTMSDVGWCAVVLTAKPLLLVLDTHLEPTVSAYGLILVMGIAPPLLCTALFPQRVRPWVLWFLGSVSTLVIVGDELSYRFFGNVLSWSALFEIPQIGQAWGSIRTLFTPDLLWLVVDVPLALAVAGVLTRHAVSPEARRSQRWKAGASVVALGIAGGVVVTPVLGTELASPRSMMERLSPFGYHVVNAWTETRWTLVRPGVTSEQKAEVGSWFAARAPLRAGRGPSFGAAQGKNLIVVQVEALQDFAVDYRVGDQAVMPHLARWPDRALRFTNVTDQTSTGRTSDAEFATLVSLPPPDDGAVAFRFAGNQHVGLPAVLAEHGYMTLSAIPFEPGFWNRRETLPAYGFERRLFDVDFEVTDQIGWGLNDRDFLQQVVPRLASLPRPFAAWLITLSLHHPFDDFPDRHKVLELGSLENTTFGNYLHAMHFFDQALADFEAALARAGLFDESVLVVFGDHDAGFRRDQAANMGVGVDDPGWELGDRVPFFVRLPQAPERLSGAVPVAAGQIDFAPTLLALMGIDPTHLPYMGRNLLGEPGDEPVLRPNGRWLNSTHLSAGGDASGRDPSCVALDTRRPVDPAECGANDEEARRAREVGRLVVVGDLQQWLRAEMATPPNRP